jgi:hypothetical protein
VDDTLPIKAMSEMTYCQLMFRIASMERYLLIPEIVRQAQPAATIPVRDARGERPRNRYVGAGPGTYFVHSGVVDFNSARLKSSVEALAGISFARAGLDISRAIIGFVSLTLDVG